MYMAVNSFFDAQLGKDWPKAERGFRVRLPARGQGSLDVVWARKEVEPKRRPRSYSGGPGAAFGGFARMKASASATTRAAVSDAFSSPWMETRTSHCS